MLTSRTNWANQFLAEEVGANFRHVIDDWRDSKQSWSSVQILEVPKQESENETNPEAHEPSYKENWSNTSAWTWN